eukprot:1194712-Prorocentrum_minimum.AAC.4
MEAIKLERKLADEKDTRRHLVSVVLKQQQLIQNAQESNEKVSVKLRMFSWVKALQAFCIFSWLRDISSRAWCQKPSPCSPVAVAMTQQQFSSTVQPQSPQKKHGAEVVHASSHEWRKG